MRTLILAALLLGALGCGSSPEQQCNAAGGHCLVGPPSNCPGVVDSSVDCNPNRNPGGAVCCLDLTCPAGKAVLGDGGCG